MIEKQKIKLFIIIALGALLILFLFKIMPDRLPALSLSEGQIAPVIISLIVVLGGFYRYLNTHGIATFAKMLISWYIIFLLGIVGYAFRFELGEVRDRVLAVIIPSYSWNSNGEIIIARSSDGQFYTTTIINGIEVKFMIDTGASDIALTKKDAQALRFDLSKLRYTKTYATANGTSAAAPVRLRTLQVGPKIFENVEASVGKGDLDISLLGMSIISRFKTIKIDKDLLTLSY